MVIRSYRPSDAEQIDEIYERCGHSHNRPDLDKVIGSVVIELNGKIVAFGALEAIAEASLILDTDAPLRTKVDAIKECYRAALFCARLHGYNAIYAFPSDNKYSETLQRHFDFEPTRPLLKREI